ncbi:Hypothetical protein FKW44_024044 [Caligus rogercresseyi]|uniref:Uncharacterized protein n=1 Tax=Caligus rogercresseyi TaxID=217165 RepID=A0A7T8JV73_CALRO|nr:Hypothetical protein FKW44_024044 [Caligus rogercresseyi]
MSEQAPGTSSSPPTAEANTASSTVVRLSQGHQTNNAPLRSPVPLPSTNGRV